MKVDAAGLFPVAVFTGTALDNLQRQQSLTASYEYYGAPYQTGEDVIEVHAGTTYSIAIYALFDGPHDFNVTFSPNSLFRFTDAIYMTSEVAGKATLSVQRFGAISKPATVKFSTRQGTAPDEDDFFMTPPAMAGTTTAAGVDFLSKISDVVFSGGDMKQNVDVTVVKDTKKEKKERFSNYLNTVDNGDTLGARNVATVYINDTYPIYPNVDFYGSWSGPLVGTAGNAQGFVKFKLTRTGKFTGTVLFNGVSYPMNGLFVEGAPENGKQTAAATVTIQRKNLTDLVVTLNLVETGPELDYQETITGTAMDGTSTGTFHASEYVGFGPGFAMPTAGTYTLSLTPDAQAPANVRATGYASLTINAKGNATWIGSLPDGTKVSGGGKVTAVSSKAANGVFLFTVFRLQFVVPLYANKGQIDGDLRFSYPGDPGDPTTLGDGEGTVRWVHRAVAAGPATAAFVSNLTPYISLYNVPTGGLILPGTAPLGISVKLEGGGLLGGPITFSSSLNAVNKATFPTDSNASIVFMPKTGLFSGKFKPTAPPPPRSPVRSCAM